MNAIPATPTCGSPPAFGPRIRSVRGGAGTALVGRYDRVAGWLGRYREAGVELVIASGYPHLEEVGRVARRVWSRLAEPVPA